MFEQTVQSPCNAKLITIPLLDEGCKKPVKTENKDEYMYLVSEFKLERCIAEETGSFCNGFWKQLGAHFTNPVGAVNYR
jgi:hypothetical protein